MGSQNDRQVWQRFRISLIPEMYVWQKKACKIFQGVYNWHYENTTTPQTVQTHLYSKPQTLGEPRQARCRLRSGACQTPK